MKAFAVELPGTVAVVTGGGGVLCSPMAKALAQCGAAVAVVDLNKEAADKVAAEIITAGGRAIGVACDVLKKESLEEANRLIEKELGPVDILVNGAGGNHPTGTTSSERLNVDDIDSGKEDVRTFYDLDAKGIGFIFDLNFMGTFLPSQVFTKAMAKKGHGTVVNISSMNAFTPLTKIPAYSAAKAAVSNFTQWLAVHMSTVGIRVNALAPGFFLTEQNRTLLTNEDGSPTERGGKIVSQTPMGRYGKPEDLLGTLLWLVCDEASGFVTGTVIPIDGGFSAYSGV
jgi:NAD(P)-dependent dehydrogenase (short-subunit alcohol dehydrogenase family)